MVRSILSDDSFVLKNVILDSGMVRPNFAMDSFVLKIIIKHKLSMDWFINKINQQIVRNSGIDRSKTFALIKKQDKLTLAAVQLDPNFL